MVVVLGAFVGTDSYVTTKLEEHVNNFVFFSKTLISYKTKSELKHDNQIEFVSTPALKFGFLSHEMVRGRHKIVTGVIRISFSITLASMDASDATND